MSLALRVFRPLVAVLACLAVTVLFPARAMAQHPAPTVTISPHNGVVTAGSITLTVDFCMPWGGYGFASQDIKLNGVDVSGNFSVGGGPGQTTECDAVERWTGTVAVDTTVTGQMLMAEVYDPYYYYGEDQLFLQLPIHARGVRVTSPAAFVTPTPGSSVSQTFTITNSGEIGTTYTLSAACTGNATACSVSPSSTSGGSVTVSFTAPSTLLDTGIVKLTATDANDWTVSGSAWTDYTVRSAPSSGTVIAHDLGNVDHGRCVTASAGSDIAMECGALRIVHPLPGVVTLGKARVPTLLYSSGQARPMPMATADVTLPTGTLPSSVDASVKLMTAPPSLTPNVSLGSASYAGSQWGAGGNTRRVAIAASVSGYATSLLDYFICIWPTGASGCTANPVGTLAVVDRSASNFGAGWWLAGLEELYFPDANRIMWVGGDGSTRVYTKINSTTYKTPAFDRPDSITVSGTTYTRWAPQKLRVFFSAAGLHDSTVNRLGHTTRFTYNSGTRQLSTISIPVKSGSPLTYAFYYDGNSVLDSVIAPNAGVSRVVRLGRSGHQVTSITDPDGSIVRFAYNSGANAYRIESRVDRRSDTTTFTYDANNQLTLSSLSMGSGAHQTQGYRLADYAYVAVSAYPLDSAYTSIDGPRSDVSDVTKIWTNLYGAPTRVRNAMGDETQLTYDTGFPGLVAQRRTPGRLRTTFPYDADGNLSGSTDYRPVGTSSNASTSYHYDPTWKLLSSVHHPQGEIDTLTYDSGTGNRLSEVGGGVTVTYGYNAAGLDSTVTVAGSYVTRVAYNALGNQSAVTTPKGYVAYRFQNAIGQDTLTASPFSDTTHASSYNASYYARVRHVYSRADRDSIAMSIGPAVGSTPSDTLTVTSKYDVEGHRTDTWRTFHVSTSSWSLQDHTDVDAAGRVTYETHPNGGSTTHYPDAAGNDTATTTGRSNTIRMRYDALNRVVATMTPSVTYGGTNCSTALLSFPYSCSWSFPTPTNGATFCINADTARFTFNGAGNLTRADNMYAQIRRGYTLNGSLAGDTLAIRMVGEPNTTPCVAPDSTSSGGDEFTHRYTITYGYDLDGRRMTMQQLGVSVNYYYNAVTGQADSLHDALSGTHTFSYDAAGRTTDLHFPNGVVDHRDYDANDQVVGRTVSGTSLSDALSYDAAGRLAQRYDAGTGINADMVYGPLGAVISAGGVTNSYGGTTSETFVVDAIGNRRSSQALNIRPSTDPDVNGVRANTIGSGGQLVSTTAPTNTAGFSFDQEQDYDGSGNVAATRTRHLTTTSGSLYEATVSYYDGADRLRIFNRASGPYGNDDSRPGHRGVYEEYRYDALGRRVWVRSQRGSTCPTSTNSECASYVERTMYDGDQVALEIRSPGAAGVGQYDLENDAAVGQGSDAYPYGKVAYVHGGGIDQPLAVLRFGLQSITDPYIIYPHLDWRNEFIFGTKPDATVCILGGSCPVNIAWPGGATTVDLAVAVPTDGPAWFGSLIPHGADGSGMQYKRNRFYDPGTGRFTQEDPIGLAGGMNLYGFASGDPVNFSDPLGLMAECDDGKPCPSLMDQVNRGMADAFANLAQKALDITAGAVNALTGLGDLFTAAGLNPNEQSKGGRMLAGAGAIMGALGGGPEFASERLLSSHFAAHGAEFGAKTAEEYLGAARSFFGGSGVETLTRTNGDRVFFKSATNEFGVISGGGNIRTYFRAEGGRDYFLRQMR